MHNVFVDRKGHIIMTIGEKIQFYRKKNGMSQEELGQILLVSRQTVSLWETGQTLPTIDNLIRLREIFGISVDELLCEGQESESEIQLPLESYTFKYSFNEIESFKKYTSSTIKNSWLIVAALLLVSLLLGASGVSEVVVGLTLGFLLAFVLGVIKSHSMQNKLWKDSQPKILRSEYSYDFYNNYFEVRISREGIVNKTFKIQYTEIEKPCDIGAFFLFQFNGQLFYIRKADLKENSVLSGLFNTQTQNQISDRKNRNIQVVSRLLVLGCVLSLVFAAQVLGALSEFNGKFVENSWVFFLFLPITIGSVIFGCKTKSSYSKTTKNIVVGIIFSILLFLYGMFCVIFSNVYDYDPNIIENVESYVGVEIPEPSSVMTQDYTENTDSETLVGMYYFSDVSFANDVAESFEKELSKSEKWASELPTEFRGLFPFLCSSVDDDYYLLYNIDSKELNTIPSETGRYRFLFVSYSIESNTMKIVEYDVDYLK